MKVFQMSDTVWWAGPEIESTKEAFMQHEEICETEYQELYAGFPVELSESDLDAIDYYDGGSDDLRTFRDELIISVASGIQFPTFFATSEY